MSEKIALHSIADAVDLQSEVLCSLIMRVKMLEAQIEQMQRTIGRNRRRSFKVMYREYPVEHRKTQFKPLKNTLDSSQR